jgi:predicted nucleic acid-binding protein
MIGLDTSILVAHAIAEHPRHQASRRWLDDAVARNETFALTSGILAEFIHIVTDGRRFETPLGIADALARAAYWSEAREVTLLASDEAANALWLRWLDDFQLGRKRLLDTLIVATWHAAGIRDICTLNPADFRVFDLFRIHDLGAEASGTREGAWT